MTELSLRFLIDITSSHFCVVVKLTWRRQISEKTVPFCVRPIITPFLMFYLFRALLSSAFTEMDKRRIWLLIFSITFSPSRGHVSAHKSGHFKHSSQSSNPLQSSMKPPFQRRSIWTHIEQYTEKKVMGGTSKNLFRAPISALVPTCRDRNPHARCLHSGFCAPSALFSGRSRPGE